MSEPDLFAVPTPNLLFAPGVFHFQAWFRDPLAGPAGFDLSDAVEVQLIP